MLGGTATRKRHRRVSYVLREEEGRHRSGINSLALNRRGELLFSAGRDATARCWSTGNPHAKCERTFDAHTDWVNDCVLLSDEATLVTCSSDTTIKLWNVPHEKCLATLTEHTDYVKALAYARDRGLLASAGLDREVLIWDMEVGRAHTGMPLGSDLRDAVPARADGHQDSVYCLATNAAGSVVVSGSTERVSRHAIGLLRMWDPRTAAKAGRLKGHTDNVRCVMISEDGSKCISGSSDATVKLWDLGQQRCIQTFNMHSDSVWTLATDVSFTRLFSGGRDKLVYCTDLRTFDSTCLIGTSDPILKLVVSTNNGLWVSMAKSDLEYWDVKDVVERHASPSNTRRPIRKSLSAQVDDESDLDPVPKLHKPHARIEGLPSIIKHDFLDNRRQVLVEDTVGAVSILDVTTGNQVKTFGRVNFERARQELEQKIAVPAWCSVDCKLGSVCVNLDFPQVFSCEVYAPDAGFPSGPDFDEQKLNVGLRICRTLFRQWRLKRNQHEPANARQRQLDDDEQDIELDERFDFDLPPDTRVIVSEGGGGCCVATKTLSQWDGREETLLPEWMVESIQRGYPSNEHGQPLADAPKIGFHLVRYPSSQDIKAMQPGKLNAPQILRARKVLSYAVSKLSLQLADVPSYMRRTGLDQPADYLELLCDDNLVPTGMNLMSIRKFLAKSPSDDLTLHYRWKESPASGARGHAEVARGVA